MFTTQTLNLIHNQWTSVNKKIKMFLWRAHERRENWVIDAFIIALHFSDFLPTITFRLWCVCMCKLDIPLISFSLLLAKRPRAVTAKHGFIHFTFHFYYPIISSHSYTDVHFAAAYSNSMPTMNAYIKIDFTLALLYAIAQSQFLSCLDN